MESLQNLLIWVGAALAVILLFGFTIFIHELGHFLAARSCGLVVDAFSLGFGPAIWKKRIGGTEYKISWIPLGGYVALPQLDPAGMQTIQGGGEGGARTLLQVAWWKRIIVSLAGPFGNVFLGVLLAFWIWALPEKESDELKFSGAVVGDVAADSVAAEAGFSVGDTVLSVQGRPVGNWSEFLTEVHLASAEGHVSLMVSNRLTGVVQARDAKTVKDKLGHAQILGLVEAHRCGIGQLMPGLPAEQAGLAEKDVLLAINGVEVHGVGHAVEMIRGSGGEPLLIDYRRKGKMGRVDVKPRLNEEGVWQVGFVTAMYVVGVPMWMQYRNPWEQLKGDAVSVGRVLSGLTSRKEAGKVGKALSGPIMIVSHLWLTVLSGLFGTLCFVRFLNINLAILNLLPLPVLDGGHIVFALWRGIFRRELPPKVIGALVNIFAVLLIGVFVWISFRDVLNLSRILGSRQNTAPAVETVTEAVEGAE